MTKKELIELLNNNLSDSGNGIRIFKRYNSLKEGDYPIAKVKDIMNLIKEEKELKHK